MLVSFKICIAFLVLAPALVFPQGVIRCPDANASLGVRWNWAKKETSSRGANGYWIGYSFMREMEKNSMVGSFYSDRRRNRPSLAEVIAGKTLNDLESWDSESGDEEKKVMREIG